MNYDMAFLADRIAEKIKRKTKSPLPAMMFHGEAYKAIREGRESDYLTKDEINKIEEMSSGKKMDAVNIK